MIFFSCEKRNSKKTLLFLHAKREISQKKIPFFHEERKIEKNFFSFLPFAITLSSYFNMHKRRIYYLKLFREVKTMMFKKIKKSDYISFKVYKSIFLLNTINKMLKLIIINKITKLTKKNLLLLNLQMNTKQKKSKRR